MYHSSLSSGDYLANELSKKDLRYEYELKVVSDCVWRFIDGVLLEHAKNAKLPGFRVGKVPKSILVKSSGEEIVDKAIELLTKEVEEDFVKAFGFNDLVYKKRELIHMPADFFAKDSSDLSISYKLEFEVMPDVPLPDFSDAEFTYGEPDVHDGDFEKYISDLLSKSGEYVAVDDPDFTASAGDSVTINFVGKVGGRVVRAVSGSDVSAKLGSGRFLNGFEQNLLGAKIGDKVEFCEKFSEDHQNAQVAGKAVDFEVDVVGIKTMKKATDFASMAKLYGFGEDKLDEFKKFLKEAMDSDLNEVSRSLFRDELVAFLSKKYLFQVPDYLLQHELNSGLRVSPSSESDANHDNPGDRDGDFADNEVGGPEVGGGDFVSSDDGDLQSSSVQVDGDHAEGDGIKDGGAEGGCRDEDVNDSFDAEQVKHEVSSNVDSEVARVFEADKRLRVAMLLVCYGKRVGLQVENEDIAKVLRRDYLSRGFSLRYLLDHMKTNQNFSSMVSGQAFEDKVIDAIVSNFISDGRVSKVEAGKLLQEL